MNNKLTKSVHKTRKTGLGKRLRSKNVEIHRKNESFDKIESWHSYPDIAGRVLFFLYASDKTIGIGTGKRVNTLYQQVKSAVGCSEPLFYETLDQLEKNRLIRRIKKHKYSLCLLNDDGIDFVVQRAKKYKIKDEAYAQWHNWGIK